MVIGERPCREALVDISITMQGLANPPQVVLTVIPRGGIAYLADGDNEQSAAYHDQNEDDQCRNFGSHRVSLYAALWRKEAPSDKLVGQAASLPVVLGKLAA